MDTLSAADGMHVTLGGELGGYVGSGTSPVMAGETKGFLRPGCPQALPCSGVRTVAGGTLGSDITVTIVRTIRIVILPY